MRDRSISAGGIADERGPRLPAAAGQFYPRRAQALARTVRRYLAQADGPLLAGVRAVIAPHAGYSFSAWVAGHSFRALAHLPDAHYTVYLMGPAHWVPVEGVGLSVQSLATPLGTVPVAAEQVSRLLALGDPYHVVEAAHAPEHCLAVQLPFLQMTLSSFRIVPMLFDRMANPSQVGDDLVDLLAPDPHSLIVVSSDLSHYHSHDEAARRDQVFLQDVIAADRVAARRGEACGLLPILCTMVVAQRLGWTARLLAYGHSGERGGPMQQVVGYGAVAYTERTHEA